VPTSKGGEGRDGEREGRPGEGGEGMAVPLSETFRRLWTVHHFVRSLTVPINIVIFDQCMMILLLQVFLCVLIPQSFTWPNLCPCCWTCCQVCAWLPKIKKVIWLLRWQEVAVLPLLGVYQHWFFRLSTAACVIPVCS